MCSTSVCGHLPVYWRTSATAIARHPRTDLGGWDYLAALLLLVIRASCSSVPSARGGAIRKALENNQKNREGSFRGSGSRESIFCSPSPLRTVRAGLPAYGSSICQPSIDGWPGEFRSAAVVRCVPRPASRCWPSRRGRHARLSVQCCAPSNVQTVPLAQQHRFGDTCRKSLPLGRVSPYPADYRPAFASSGILCGLARPLPRGRDTTRGWGRGVYPVDRDGDASWGGRHLIARWDIRVPPPSNEDPAAVRHRLSAATACQPLWPLRSDEPLNGSSRSSTFRVSPSHDPP